MTGNKVLFDTNAFIAWTFEDPQLAEQLLDLQFPCISVISIGELTAGAMKSSRPSENLSALTQRLKPFQIVDVDRACAETYARIRHQLRTRGRPMPANDNWIAATALRHGLPVVTRDQHFSQIDGLAIVEW